MLGVISSNVFYSKIVNHKGEGDGTAVVGEEAGRMLCLGVTVLCKMWDKSFVRDAAGLWEAIHCAANFCVHMIMVDERAEVEVIKHAGWNITEADPHVLGRGKRGIEIEVFNVDGHEFCSRRREDAVEEYFGGGNAGRFRADLAKVVNTIPAHGETDAAGLFLLWAVGDDDA